MIYSKLLQTELFIDNNYLLKYCELINANLYTTKVKGATNSHHIIPVCWFEYFNLPVDNSIQNRVNLLYKDHILAHYYLAMCIKESVVYYKLVSAFCRMVKQPKKYFITVEERELIENLDCYQKLYEIDCSQKSIRAKNRVKTAEEIQKQINSRHNNGRPWHTDEARQLMSKSATGLDHSNYSKAGYTQEWKNKISASKLECGNGHTGKKYINNGTDCFCIELKDFSIWESKGYTWGRLTSDIARKSFQKKVYCIELDKTFDSLSDAAAELNLQISKISLCCNGKCKTTGGYHWTFIKE